MKFQVIPTTSNKQYNLVEGAFAHCWILDNNPNTAYNKATFFISKYDWKIVKLEHPPVITTEEHYQGKDIGLEHYKKAHEEGVAIVYIAWSKDGKTTAGPIPLKPSYDFDLDDFLKTQKKLNKKGRCLHYDRGHRCTEIINAHSIQKNQSLSSISDCGHVYTISSNIGLLKKNKGNFDYVKSGVNKVSTFLGFCKKHDNDLFSEIDNAPLYPTDQQVLLYAYRSICRELFVKENAFNLFDNQSYITKNQNTISNLLASRKSGLAFGLNNLIKQKSYYDNSLKKQKFSDIRYVLFISKQKPTITFSGLFYPDFDFMGRQLQDLGDHKAELELIAICSAPMNSGWGFLFSWHNSSSNTCVKFMRALATTLHEKQKLGDLLFRMTISNCENHAISPKWWEQLSKSEKDRITHRVNSMGDIFSAIDPTYLIKGVEGIVDWEFESVISKMD